MLPGTRAGVFAALVFLIAAFCQVSEINPIFRTQRTPEGSLTVSPAAWPPHRNLVLGASFSCSIAYTRLMCWICDPNQALFYVNDQLTVCEGMCDYVLAACHDVVFKGQKWSDLYANGRAFCEARDFRVADENCFSGGFETRDPGWVRLPVTKYNDK